MSAPLDSGDVPELLKRWLAGRPLAERSRREYVRNVRAYCAWPAATPDREGWQGDPLADPLVRDHAARDFRRYLQVERRAVASTVNLALASLDALYGATERTSGSADARRAAGAGRDRAATAVAGGGGGADPRALASGADAVHGPADLRGGRARRR